MASTFTSLDVKVASDMAVQALFKKADDFLAFSTAVGAPQVKRVGDTVLVPVLTMTDDAADYNASSNNFGTIGTDATTGVSVTLQGNMKKTFQIPMEQYTPELLNLKLANATEFCLTQVAKKCHNEITAAVFGAASFTGAASTFDTADLIDLRDIANSAAFGMDRVALLDGPYVSALLKADALIAMRNVSGGNGLDRFADLAGFKIVESLNIQASTPGAGAENLRGFITDKSAIAVALVYPEVGIADQFATQIERTVINGVPVQYYWYMDPTTRSLNVSAEIGYGVKVLRAGSLKRIISA